MLKRNCARRMAALLTLVLCQLGLAAVAQAQIRSAWTEGLNSRARLVVGHVTPAPGQPEGGLYAGVEILLADGWKTYWRTPGDSGIPPNFDWSGSLNVAATQTLYPAPRRLSDPSGHSIGYKKRVLFPVWIKPRDSGKSMTLNLTLDYAVCAELCIPTRAQLSLAVPTTVALALGPAADLQESLDAVPRPMEDTSRTAHVSAVRVDASSSPARVLIEVSQPANAGEVDLFVEGPSDWYLTLPEPQSAAPGADGAQRRTYALPLDALPKDARIPGATLFFTLLSGEGAFSQSWTLQ